MFFNFIVVIASKLDKRREQAWKLIPLQYFSVVHFPARSPPQSKVCWPIEMNLRPSKNCWSRKWTICTIQGRAQRVIHPNLWIWTHLISRFVSSSLRPGKLLNLTFDILWYFRINLLKNLGHTRTRPKNWTFRRSWNRNCSHMATIMWPSRSFVFAIWRTKTKRTNCNMSSARMWSPRCPASTVRRASTCRGCSWRRSSICARTRLIKKWGRRMR